MSVSRSMASAGIAMLMTVVHSPAFGRQANDQALDRDARTILDLAVSGRSEAAFERAQSLRMPSDQLLASRLDQTAQAFAARRARQIPPRSVTLLEESHFGACVHRTYAVRYADSTDRWHFSWRDSSHGWRLSDLLILE